MMMSYLLLAHAYGQSERESSQPEQTSNRDHQLSIPIRVAGQVVFGAVGGITGAILAKVHPALGGVGWTFGSSFGVYAIGNSATHTGSYWWTFSAGAITVLAWTPAMINSRGIESGAAVAGAVFTSLISEIVVYYVTEGEPTHQTLTISLSPSGLASAGRHLPAGQGGYAMTICLTL